MSARPPASTDRTVTHRSSPLTPEGRRRLVERCKSRPIARIAAEMGISRATASKWVNRGETNREPQQMVAARPAGRRGWVILMGVGVVFLALFATSLALVIAGRAVFALLCAAVTFAAMFVCAWLYDASFRSEVTHAG